MRYALFLILIALGACSKRISPTSVSSTSDSTVTTYTPREIKFKLEAAEVNFVKHIECDPIRKTVVPFEETRTKGRAKVKVQVNSKGDLTVTANCDSLEQVIHAMDKEIFRLRTEKKEITVPVYMTRKIDIYCRWIAGSSILLFALAIILWVKKRLQFF